ncbi:hypothetical protein GS416_07485 [Rhodococcus hoagii]|nr:hypothetical protein [Prescottella equi]
MTYTPPKIWKNSGISRYITTIRQIAPRASNTSPTRSASSRPSPTRAPPASRRPVSGGGCNSVPVLGNKGYLDNVDFAVTYKIPDTRLLATTTRASFSTCTRSPPGRAPTPPARGFGVADPVPTTTTVQDPGVRGRRVNP